MNYLRKNLVEFILIFGVFVFIYSNMFSQQKQYREELFKKHFEQTFNANEEEGNRKQLLREKFNKNFAKIEKTITIDSNSVVDSILVTKANGDAEKHIYKYDNNRNLILHLIINISNNTEVYLGRKTYTYDLNGNKTSYLYEKYKNNGWVEEEKEQYIYDFNGNLILKLDKTMDRTYSYLVDRRSSYTYNSTGKIILIIKEIFDNNQWVNDTKIIYKYDSNEREIYNALINWDISSNKWEDYPFSRSESTYDNKGRVTFYSWYWGAVYLEATYTYTDDSDGNLMFLSVKRREPRSEFEGEHWERDSYTYNTHGKVTTLLTEKLKNEQWINWHRTTYTYDNNNDRVITEKWEDGQWVNSWRVNHTYNLSGNEILYLYEEWANGQWINFYRNIYTYDSNENITYYASEKWDNSNWIPDDASFKFNDSFGRNYSLYSCSEVNIYYSSITTSVARTFRTKTNYSLQQNYPNPFNPTTTISYTLPLDEKRETKDVKLIVFDLLGKEVETLVNKEQQAGNYKVTFKASNLPSGIYFYRLQSGSFVETKKFVLLK